MFPPPETLTLTLTHTETPTRREDATHPGQPESPPTGPQGLQGPRGQPRTCPAGPGLPAVRQKKPGYLLRMKVTWERRRCCLFLGFWSKATSTQPSRPAAAGLTPAAARWSLRPVWGTALSPRAQHRRDRGQRAPPSVPGVLYPRSAQSGPSEQGPCGFETWLPGSTSEAPCVKGVRHGTPQGKPSVNTFSHQNFCFLRVCERLLIPLQPF